MGETMPAKKAGAKEKNEPQQASGPANAKAMPTGVKVISVLYYIGAAIDVLLGIIFFFGADAISALQFFNNILKTGLFTLFGIFFIAFGILSFFIGRGLWKGQNWARMAAIVLVGLSAVFALVSIVANFPGRIFVLILDGIIGGYLLFSKDVKAAFA